MYMYYVFTFLVGIAAAVATVLHDGVMTPAEGKTTFKHLTICP